MNITEQQEKAFWSKVNMRISLRECWEWCGARKPKGYGNVRINKKYMLAHRVAFTLANGEIPDGYKVCHICDNPSCCNPNHLMLGTTRSNAADMLLKNRQKDSEIASKGMINGNSKLKDEEVKEIRSLYESNKYNQYQLAKKYRVSQPTIGHIVRRETWRHL